MGLCQFTQADCLSLTVLLTFSSHIILFLIPFFYKHCFLLRLSLSPLLPFPTPVHSVSIFWHSSHPSLQNHLLFTLLLDQLLKASTPKVSFSSRKWSYTVLHTLRCTSPAWRWEAGWGKKREVNSQFLRELFNLMENIVFFPVGKTNRWEFVWWHYNIYHMLSWENK